MEYFEHLGLAREPFSNSPDPEFLYYSRQHIACLQEMEIALRLQRGLNVVIGAVGTGKTTLIRRLIRNLEGDPRVRLTLVLDPYFKTPHSFLRMLCSRLLGTMPDRRLNTFALKEMLKEELLSRATGGHLVSVLLVDEAQKMTPECLEVLRELLNYETNDRKLLQILLFGQPELEPVIDSMENFKDRINTCFRLRPFSMGETRAMIRYRVEMATGPGRAVPELFSRWACRAIHRASGGYPRKTVRLCHKVVLSMLVHDKKRAGASLVGTVIREQTARPGAGRALVWATALSAALVVCGLAGVRYSPGFRALVGGVSTAVASTYDRVSGVIGQHASHGRKDIFRDAQSGLIEAPAPHDAAATGGPVTTLADYTAAEMRTPDPATSPALDPEAEPLDAPLEPDRAAESGIDAPAGPEPLAVLDSGLAPRPATGSAQAPVKPHNPREDGFLPAADGALAQMPALLGVVPVMPRESFSVMVHNIYGVYDRATAARVLAANPAIRDEHSLEVGQAVRFPVIDPGEEAVSDRLVWVRLAVERDLSRAYGRARATSHFGLRSRILPYMAADGALAFAVVLEEPFTSRAKANAARSTLPLALQKEAVAMPSPGPGVGLARMNETAWDVLQAMLQD